MADFAHLTNTGGYGNMRIGATKWKAPEQLKDNIHVRYTRASDIFAFGMFVYQVPSLLSTSDVGTD